MARAYLISAFLQIRVLAARIVPRIDLSDDISSSDVSSHHDPPLIEASTFLCIYIVLPSRHSFFPQHQHPQHVSITHTQLHPTHRLHLLLQSCTFIPRAKKECTIPYRALLLDGRCSSTYLKIHISISAPLPPHQHLTLAMLPPGRLLLRGEAKTASRSCKGCD